MIRYSEEEKQTHLALWQESGLSKRAYSIASGLKYRTFLRWFGMLSLSDALPQTKESDRFLSVSIDEPKTFTESIEIHYPGGVIVKLPGTISLDRLKSLLV